MANAQPANQLISIFYTVRSRINVDRFVSIKEMAQGLGVRQVIIPGQEISFFNVVDANFKSDAWRYGHPIVEEARGHLSVSQFYASAGNLDFPVHLVGHRGDLFFQLLPASVSADIQGEAQTAGPGPAGMFLIGLGSIVY